MGAAGGAEAGATDVHSLKGAPLSSSSSHAAQPGSCVPPAAQCRALGCTAWPCAQTDALGPSYDALSHLEHPLVRVKAQRVCDDGRRGGAGAVVRRHRLHRLVSARRVGGRLVERAEVGAVEATTQLAKGAGSSRRQLQRERSRRARCSGCPPAGSIWRKFP